MFLEYREGGFAVTEVAVVITEGETRGELSQVAFADRLTTQRAQTLSTGISPVHQDEFHMRPPPENWLPTIFALEADPNVVPSSRQSGIGRCRSNKEWRELGDWNRTSSTLVRRSPDGGIRWSFRGPDISGEFKIGRLHQRQVGRLRIEKWSASNRKFLAGLISELSRSSWGLQEGSLHARNRIGARLVRSWQSPLSNFSLDR
jgi:hypothetical protein